MSLIKNKDIKIKISDDINKILTQYLQAKEYSKVLILVDTNTEKKCLSYFKNLKQFASLHLIIIPPGDKNKNIESTQVIWEYLSTHNADRSSLLINLGGGMICDLGGFAASTFKRGINFINIPTTLLSQVDASIGGKTGINFLGLKNELGLFQSAKQVLIDSVFLKTLDKRNILSGWAEMIKHTLIYNYESFKILSKNKIKNINYEQLNILIEHSINIKKHFVDNDPEEQGIRKSLNFGHTFGHAFESFFLTTKNNLLHGEAIAHGMICELILSKKRFCIDTEKINEIISYLLSLYKKIEIDENDFEKISLLMSHDKKNTNTNINITLLKDIGKPIINQKLNKDEIFEILNNYSNL
ncbi:MAG: 3-dehydroquinate synthase [Bacteroidales bacterium]|jgi:3-dehydroquinate synthase|nr:3-dehydroquinate synthase [Bacteroidales bacterium]